MNRQREGGRERGLEEGERETRREGRGKEAYLSTSFRAGSKGIGSARQADDFSSGGGKQAGVRERRL